MYCKKKRLNHFYIILSKDPSLKCREFCLVYLNNGILIFDVYICEYIFRYTDVILNNIFKFTLK